VGALDDDDLTTRYHEYLDRFATEIGQVAIGSFAKFDGKLIKKLAFDEFVAAVEAYDELSTRYRDSVDRGDTINDAAVKILREQAAALVLKPPV
jgi:hypothetical protein